LSVPDYLGQAEICNLDLADSAAADPGNEFTFVDLVLVSRLLGLWMLGGDNRYRAEQDILRLDIPILSSQLYWS
jgi:hypothetical protein